MNIQELYSLYQKNGYQVTTDSRKVNDGAIFFALRGEKFDGNAFVKNALDAGASFCVIDNPAYFIQGKTWLVDDSLKTLQEFAKYHRAKLDIPVLGLTGTAGKTTTKELIRQVLAEKFTVYATEGNLNNHIGVPLTILRIKPDVQIAVIEMGASYPGDIELLCDIANPNLGLITNIGTAHIQGFGSREVLVKTKTALYRHLEAHDGQIFMNYDDVFLKSLTKHNKIYYYGTSQNADTHGKVIELNPFLKMQFRTKDGGFLYVQTQLFGEYNLYNLLAAIAVGQFFDIDDEKIKKALENYEPKNQRSQIFKTQKNTLILDLYNANPTSMSEALRSFAKIKATDKVLILGDMLELGGIENAEHQKILDLARHLGFEQIYLVGKIFGRVNEKYPHFQTSDELRKFLEKNPLQDKYILLKASRGIHLENVIDVL